MITEPNLSAAYPPLSPELRSILQRPLIIGASVSANHRGVASPARQLALRATSASEIRTIAKNGRAASETLALVQDADLKDRSCVIGIDLLFWDSTRPSIAATLHQFHSFVEKIVRAEIPFAIGEVPGFFPPMQPNWKRLNAEIQKIRGLCSGCVVLPFDQIYHRILSEDGYLHRGKRYALGELVPDGLHLSKIAGELLADELQSTWEAKLKLSPSP